MIATATFIETSGTENPIESNEHQLPNTRIINAENN
jgi:hypothetical protein